MTAWINTDCGCCAGIEWGGEYPRECATCGGTGGVWVSDKDRLADWPGGPMRGSDPGRFAAVAARVGVAMTGTDA